MRGRWEQQLVELLVVPGKNEHRSFFVLYQGTTLSRAAKFGNKLGFRIFVRT